MKGTQWSLLQQILDELRWLNQCARSRHALQQKQLDAQLQTNRLLQQLLRR
jgi:hypothetical protein